MKRILFLISLLLICTDSFIYSQELNVVHGNIIAMLKSSEDVDKLVASFQTIDGNKTEFKVKEYISKSMNIVLYEFNVSAINENKMLNAIKTSAFVSIAQFNHTFKNRTFPNDSLFSQQWNMNNTGQTGGTAGADISAVNAWNITTGGITAQGDTIVVAIVDDGFDLTHHDLNYFVNRQEIPGNLTDDDGNGYVDDVVGWNGGTATDVIPVASHGTHVTGIAGARGNNISGVTGVNQNVRIMPVCYGTGSDTLLESHAVACYAYIRDQRKLYNQTNGAKGAFVVSTNSSFGIDHGQPSAYPVWCAMYDSLGAVGVLSAAATANANWNIDIVGDIPTGCASNWLVTVTNTNASDLINPNAAFGATTIDLGAPGTSVTSTVPPNTYAGGAAWTGTSMASPHVAGAIALMYSVQCAQFIAGAKQYPASMALIVKDSLLNATDPNSSLAGNTVSGGRLNLYKAVRAIQNYCLSPTTTLGILSNGIMNEELMIENISPNPANTVLDIVYNSYQSVDIAFSNILGQEIKRIKKEITNVGIQHTTVDLSFLSEGVYFIYLSSANKKSNVVKLVVTHP